MRKLIFAIDPGNELSAYCVMNENYELIEFDKLPNRECMEKMLKWLPDVYCVVIERMLSYSANVGRTTFETCEWIGRFSQEAEKITSVDYLTRKDEKMYLCQTMKANDATIRHALIDRFAKFDFRNGRGSRNNPDFFYGVKADCWSAVAIAVVYLDMQKEKENAKV